MQHNPSEPGGDRPQNDPTPDNNSQGRPMNDNQRVAHNHTYANQPYNYQFQPEPTPLPFQQHLFNQSSSEPSVHSLSNQYQRLPTSSTSSSVSQYRMTPLNDYSSQHPTSSGSGYLSPLPVQPSPSTSSNTDISTSQNSFTKRCSITIRIIFTIIIGILSIFLGLTGFILTAFASDSGKLDAFCYTASLIWLIALNFVSAGIQYLVTIRNSCYSENAYSTNEHEAWVLLWSITSGHFFYTLICVIIWVPCSFIIIRPFLWLLDFASVYIIIIQTLFLSTWVVDRCCPYHTLETVPFVLIALKLVY